jgi:electron transfer flavoprotein beta subunit
MKIAVLVKSVADTSVTSWIMAGGKTAATDQVEFVLSPYEECLVEEALKLKESVGAAVTAVSAGKGRALKALRLAFTMGIEEGVLVRPPVDTKLTAPGVAALYS